MKYLEKEREKERERDRERERKEWYGKDAREELIVPHNLCLEDNN